MARTQFLEIPDELKNLYNASLEKRDRFQLGVLQGHKHLPSKKQKKLLSRSAVVNSPQEGRGSLFRFLSPLWRGLTTEQKAVWASAGSVMGLSNWQLFISDNAARIRNSLELEVPPSELWQVRTGYVTIEDPADTLILKQEHPLDYWIAEKVVGQSWKKELVLLRENFSLPIELKIRYKSDLEPVSSVVTYTPPAGDSVNFSLSEYTPSAPYDFDFESPSDNIARYYAKVWTSYQGEDIYTDVAIDFAHTGEWTLGTATISGLRGIILGYTLYLEIVGYRGTLMFDNIRATHGGTNWARDPRCDDVSKQFTKAFAVVPPFWIPVSLPEGANFDTVFPPSL